MSGKTSRTKGCVNEREVAGMLESWWQGVEPGCSFVRTPSSGGWSTPKVRAEFRASGDVMTTAKRFPFGVEVKRREGFVWSTVVAGKASPVWSWWMQTGKAALEQLESVPMLWMRRNGERWRVMLPERVLERLIGGEGLMQARFVVARGIRVPVAAFAYPEMPVGIVSAQSLLAVHPVLLLQKLTEVRRDTCE